MSEANFFSEFCKSLVARSAERSEGTRARRDVISAPLPRSAERSEALRGNAQIYVIYSFFVSLWRENSKKFQHYATQQETSYFGRFYETYEN